MDETRLVQPIEDDEDLGEVSKIFVDAKKRKILDEDRYFEMMGTIIRRDFFSDVEFPNRVEKTHPTGDSPGTLKSTISASSSKMSDIRACNRNLNDFFENYTSEDNAHFDELQLKDLRLHKAKYPWLYRSTASIESSKQETSTKTDNKSLVVKDSKEKLVQGFHNPRNSLFYPPSDVSHLESTSTVNYHSSIVINEPQFREPQPRPKRDSRVSNPSRFDVDGQFMNPETSKIENQLLSSFNNQEEDKSVKITQLKTRDYKQYELPPKSPKEDVANRLYQTRMKKSINKMKQQGQTPSSRGSTSRRSTEAGFSFKKEHF